MKYECRLKAADDGINAAVTEKRTSMPSEPPPTPPTPVKQRRRPAPGLGGNWLWLVLIGILFLLFFNKSLFSGGGPVEYGEYYQLLTDPELSKNIKHITSENTQVVVEVNDRNKLPPEWRDKVSGNKFIVQRLRGADEPELARLHALIRRKEDPNAGVEYGDFYRLVMDDNASRNVKRVVYEGPDRLVVEVADAKQLPPDMQKKAQDGKFTIQRSHFLEDKELDERLKKLALRQSNLGVAGSAAAGAALAAVAPPAPLKLDVQDEYGGAPPTKVDQGSDTLANWGPTLLLILFMVALTVVLFVFLLPRFRDPLGGGFLSNYIKSPAKRYERNKQRVTFDDVAGMLNAKGELEEIVEFLRSPEKFTRLGAVVPKGVLLVGPPGTGKTLLAKAVAGEAGVPFFSISGSEFIQMFVGVGASRVRDMFKTAKENSPSILFIDEIDAVGRMRGAGVGGGSDEREQTLNQILSEMDGFQPNEAVIVMAATNRPDVLDSALLRPGRFDRHITIDRPTWQGRLAILKIHTRNKPLSDEVNLESVARSMIGMTGADLRNLANEAALLATREGKSKIERIDFARAADRVLIGAKREEVLSAEEKRRTAYHEAGHALLAWLVPEAEKPIKVSIVPRGRAGGVNLIAPDEDRFHHGMDYFKAQIVMSMGGRAVERLVYGQPFAGVESDLKQATRIARYMVTHWGMSERLGPMAFRVGEEHIFLGKEIQEARDFSERSMTIIDEEVQKILREADEQAFDLLQKDRDKIERIVDALMQREELTREEIEALLHETNGLVPATDTAVQTSG
jgi:cell division protease FtsH